MKEDTHHCKFDALKTNMQNIYKAEGIKWIAQLPIMVDSLREYWQLINITPVANMSFHFVAKAETVAHKPVVLKIGLDKKSIENEKNILKFFAGEGAIQLLDYNDEYNAMLLEQAIPGYSLKSLYPTQQHNVIKAYCDTMHKFLNKEPPSEPAFPHISYWLTAIDNASTDIVPKPLIARAIKLKTTLLNTLSQEKLLHGDLHHDNILKNSNEWIIIDPKGVIGEIEFEAAAFDFIDKSELQNINIKQIFNERISAVATVGNLNVERLKDWVFVRLVLSAVWSIEDNDDPSFALHLAELI